jgi:DNA repair photolyase
MKRDKMKKKRVFGTREWAKYSLNCCVGCPHDCRYCFARYNAIDRYKNLPEGSWTDEKIQTKMLNKKFGLRDGVTMFPTTHDITPTNLDACLTVLKNVLSPGNSVLVVSKPHIDCIKSLCDSLGEYKEQILFRFTIGASDNDILSYWEPGAPNYEERLSSLKYAFDNGFRTSVSMEPVLDWKNIVSVFKEMAPFVTDSIWVGAMNFIEQRVKIENDEDRIRAVEIKRHQHIETYQEVYSELKDHPLIKWKESLKEALGLEEASEDGLDI